MIKVTIEIQYYPVYEAYSRTRGILFHLLGGGWCRSYTDKITGKEMAEYRVWGQDVQFLRLMCDELPF